MSAPIEPGFDDDIADGPNREKLSREGIVQAAMRMLDAEGEKSFSMRKLARTLGVDPMAIYHHHASKAVLLHEVLQLLMLECEVPDAGGDWQEDIRALSRHIRALALRHPGAFRLYETYDEWLPAEHRVHEAVYSALNTSGLPAQKVVQAGRVIIAYVEAFAVDEITGWLEPADKAELAQSLEAGSYPVMQRLIDEIGTRNADADFEFGLDVLLCGIRAQMT